MNPTVSKTIQIATVAGSAILVINSVAKLTGVKSPKEAVMPVVSILVGFAAFNYAYRSGISVTTKEVK